MHPNDDTPLEPHCGICCCKIGVGEDALRIRQATVRTSKRHGQKYVNFEEFLNGDLEQYFCERCLTSRLDLTGTVSSTPKCDSCDRRFPEDELMFVIDPGVFRPSKRHDGYIFSTMDPGDNTHTFYFCEDCAQVLEDEEKPTQHKLVGNLPKAFR